MTVATVNTTPNRTVTLSNRELVCAVRAINASTLQGYATINAGNFPWLGVVASAFDCYKFTSLEFEYVPSTPTTTVGRCVFFVDYDPLDDNSALVPEGAAATGGAVSTQPYAMASVKFRQDGTVLPQHKYFVKCGGTPDRLADCGRFWWYTETTTGAAADPGVVWGSVYAKYTVTLFNCEPSRLVGQAATATTKTSTPTVSNDAPFGIAADAKTVSHLLETFQSTAKNLSDNVSILMRVIPQTGVTGMSAFKTPAMEDVYHYDSATLVNVGHTEMIPPDSMTTLTAHAAALPNVMWIVYSPQHDEFTVSMHLDGTWTPAVGDDPGFVIDHTAGWGATSWDVVQSPTTYAGATYTHITWLLHMIKDPSRECPSVGITIYCTGTGAWTNTNFWFDCMCDSQPRLDNRTLTYGF